jgi:hypothetical protein
MDAGRPLPLTSSGTPHPYPEEVVYRLQAEVDLYDGPSKLDGMRKGVATLTSHRVYWSDAARTTAVQWHLGQVVGAHGEEGGLLFGSSKVVVTVRPLAAAVAAGSAYPSLPSSASSSSSAAALPHIKLSFKEGGRDQFLEDLRKALQRKAWVVVDDLEMMAGLGSGASGVGRGGTAAQAGAPPAEKRGRNDGFADAGAQSASSSSAAAASSTGSSGATATAAPATRTAVGVGAVFEQRAKVRESVWEGRGGHGDGDEGG